MANENHLLTDIKLSLRHKDLRPVYRVETAERLLPDIKRRIEDMETVTGTNNLAQAVIIRLLTPRGELSALGHPEYGSRLHELIGDLNTETKHSLVKLYILESLQMESRIEEIIHIAVKPDSVNRKLVNVTLAVKPAGYAGTVSIGPFTLEFEQ